jgi:hypothetical protein
LAERLSKTDGLSEIGKLSKIEDLSKSEGLPEIEEASVLKSCMFFLNVRNCTEIQKR